MGPVRAIHIPNYCDQASLTTKERLDPFFQRRSEWSQLRHTFDAAIPVIRFSETFTS
jgi:hypothetical protein